MPRTVVCASLLALTLLGCEEDMGQDFVPQEGYLALAQKIGVPEAPVVSAQVGDRPLTLAVRGCGGGPR